MLITKYLSNYLTDYPITILGEVNIFHKNNKILRKYFLFFFLIAICGYASIMTCRFPYSDDYGRYLINYTCGQNCRYGTWLLEILSFFSFTITDGAPFTQIISCGLLSYVALICVKIMDHGGHIESECSDDIKYSALLCFIPVVVNPYLTEIMIFRFDNVHMNLALLSATLSSYLSLKNDKRCLFFQTIFLFYSLLFYQAAVSIYFMFFLIHVLREIAHGKSIKEVMVSMRYWFITMIITALVYWPFICDVQYAKKNGVMLLIPYNMKNIQSIAYNIWQYLSDLKKEWMHHFSGQSVAFLMLTATASFVRESIASKKCLINVFLIVLLFGCLLLSPYGINIFLNYAVSRSSGDIPVRVLYCFGVLISFIFFRNYLFFEKITHKLVKRVYVVFLFFFGIWNIIIVNSASNILYMQSVLQHNVFYDLGKDLDDIFQKNKGKELYVYHRGVVMSPIFRFFVQEYPIFNKVMIETWAMPNYCLMGFYCRGVANALYELRKDVVMRHYFNGKDFNSSRLLKSHFWYDIRILDEKILLIAFKNGKKICDMNDMLKIPL